MLQDEAEGLERELKNKERSKGALKTQERLHKDQFNGLKANPKRAPLEEFIAAGTNFDK